jgi:hypothetical protein
MKATRWLTTSSVYKTGNGPESLDSVLDDELFQRLAVDSECAIPALVAGFLAAQIHNARELLETANNCLDVNFQDFRDFCGC